MNPNPLVTFLNKPASEFTKADIIRYVEEQGIRMINFRYAGGDGRLKALNFVIGSSEHLKSLLSTGERVDGSSLFPFIQAGSSDLYVVPRYKTAFLNPFSDIPAIDIMCAYYDKDGKPLESSPQYVLQKAHNAFRKHTGYEFHAMGELEYYVIDDNADVLYPAVDQKGYHETLPFSKWDELRVEAMDAMAKAGCLIKYGHSEVGNFTLNGKLYEQNEIEFMPVNVEDAADQLVKAKWILRTLASKKGVTVTFAPKITAGKAGSGLHVHTKIMKNGKNLMISDGKLSDTARRAIAGYLELAPSLTAFGNTNPSSYFRLVPHQEAPTNICWGDRNRSVLVRVPLGWQGSSDMLFRANPLEKHRHTDFSDLQTVEFRCPDGSADIYLLMAGLTVAARHGLELPEALQIAEDTYVDVNIFDDMHKERVARLKQLPSSCWDSAARLEEQAEIYTKYNVFPSSLIHGIAHQLRSYADKDLHQKVDSKEADMLEIVRKYFHCG